MKSQSGTATIHQKKPDVKAEDEWAHLTDATGAETKIQAADAADVSDRNIFVGKGKEGTPWEIVSKKTQNLADMTSNISQYVKLVNAYLQEQKKQVVKIQDRKNKFDLEIESLQKDNVQLGKLNNTPIDEFDLNELNQLVQGLTKIRNSRQSKIKELKNELTKTGEELRTQDIQIEKINAQIKQKQEIKKENDSKGNKTKDQLAKELSSLIKKYNSKTVTTVLKEINSL